MKRALLRSLAALLALDLLASPCLADAAQSSLWSERRHALAPTVQVAALPTSPALGSVLQSLPRPQIAALSPSIESQLARAPSAGVRERLEHAVRAVPADAATVRDVTATDDPKGRVIVHVQDVHLNDEAQANISRVVAGLAGDAGAGVVALEGAFGPIDLAGLRALPDRAAVKASADYLRDHRRISGPVYAGLTMASAPVFVGIDDRAGYDGNVSAYRRAAPARAAAQERLNTMDRDVEARKLKTFSPALRRFDAGVRDYDRGRAQLSDYVRLLARDAAAPPAVRDFLAAHELETKMDFNRVEADRARYLAALVARLSPADVDGLIKMSVDYRLGRTGHGAFYAALRALGERRGVSLSRYPAMDAYVRYVLLSDGIRPQELFRDLDTMRAADYRALATTPAEAALVAESERLSLAAKLLDFSLTPDEWARYRAIAAGKLPALGDISAFESFYTDADRRSDAMTENLLAAMDKAGARVAVLVTGGFHGPGIGARLAKAGVSTVDVVPRLTRIGDGTAYLSFFAQEKTPLDRLFQGPKLFLAPAPAPEATLEVGELLAAGASRSEPVREQESRATGVRFRTVRSDGIRRAEEIIPPSDGTPVVTEGVEDAASGPRITDVTVAPRASSLPGRLVDRFARLPNIPDFLKKFKAFDFSSDVVLSLVFPVPTFSIETALDNTNVLALGLTAIALAGAAGFGVFAAVPFLLLGAAFFVAFRVLFLSFGIFHELGHLIADGRVSLRHPLKALGDAVRALHIRSVRQVVAGWDLVAAGVIPSERATLDPTAARIGALGGVLATTLAAAAAIAVLVFLPGTFTTQAPSHMIAFAVALVNITMLVLTGDWTDVIAGRAVRGYWGALNFEGVPAYDLERDSAEEGLIGFGHVRTAGTFLKDRLAAMNGAERAAFLQKFPGVAQKLKDTEQLGMTIDGYGLDSFLSGGATDAELIELVMADYVAQKGDARADSEDNHFRSVLGNGVAVLGLFDGMGGGDSGGTASRMARDVAQRLLAEKLSGAVDREAVLRALTEVHAEMVRTVGRFFLGRKTKGGTTATIAVLLPQPDGTSRAYVLSAADSRAYAYSNGKLRHLTADNVTPDDVKADRLILDADKNEVEPRRSDRQRMLDEAGEPGVVGNPAAGHLKNGMFGRLRARIRGYIGTTDRNGPVEIEASVPVITEATLQPGEMLLLTTDGVHDNLVKSEMETELAPARTPQEAVRRLTFAARRRSLAAPIAEQRGAGDSQSRALPVVDEQQRNLEDRAKDDDISALAFRVPTAAEAAAKPVAPAPIAAPAAPALEEAPLNLVPDKDDEPLLDGAVTQGLVLDERAGTTVLVRSGGTEAFIRRNGNDVELVLSYRDKVRSTVKLNPGETYFLGREAEENLRTGDGRLSRYHLSIRLDRQGRLTVRDLYSTNGSYLTVKRAAAPWSIKEGTDPGAGMASAESVMSSRINAAEVEAANSLSMVREDPLSEAVMRRNEQEIQGFRSHDGATADEAKRLTFYKAYATVLVRRHDALTSESDKLRDRRALDEIFREAKTIRDGVTFTEAPVADAGRPHMFSVNAGFRRNARVGASGDIRAVYLQQSNDSPVSPVVRFDAEGHPLTLAIEERGADGLYTPRTIRLQAEGLEFAEGERGGDTGEKIDVSEAVSFDVRYERIDVVFITMTTRDGRVLNFHYTPSPRGTIDLITTRPKNGNANAPLGKPAVVARGIAPVAAAKPAAEPAPAAQPAGDDTRILESNTGVLASPEVHALIVAAMRGEPADQPRVSFSLFVDEDGRILAPSDAAGRDLRPVTFTVRNGGTDARFIDVEPGGLSPTAEARVRRAIDELNRRDADASAERQRAAEEDLARMRAGENGDNNVLRTLQMQGVVEDLIASAQRRADADGVARVAVFVNANGRIRRVDDRVLSASPGEAVREVTLTVRRAPSAGEPILAFESADAARPLPPLARDVLSVAIHRAEEGHRVAQQRALDDALRLARNRDFLRGKEMSSAGNAAYRAEMTRTGKAEVPEIQLDVLLDGFGEIRGLGVPGTIVAPSAGFVVARVALRSTPADVDHLRIVSAGPGASETVRTLLERTVQTLNEADRAARAARRAVRQSFIAAAGDFNRNVLENFAILAGPEFVAASASVGRNGGIRSNITMIVDANGRIVREGGEVLIGQAAFGAADRGLGTSIVVSVNNEAFRAEPVFQLVSDISGLPENVQAVVRASLAMAEQRLVERATNEARQAAAKPATPRPAAPKAPPVAPKSPAPAAKAAPEFLFVRTAEGGQNHAGRLPAVLSLPVDKKENKIAKLVLRRDDQGRPILILTNTADQTFVRRDGGSPATPMLIPRRTAQNPEAGLVVGRTESADLRLDTDLRGVSRRHYTIYVNANDQVIVEDGSTNYEKPQYQPAGTLQATLINGLLFFQRIGLLGLLNRLGLSRLAPVLVRALYAMVVEAPRFYTFNNAFADQHIAEGTFPESARPYVRAAFHALGVLSLFLAVALPLFFLGFDFGSASRVASGVGLFVLGAALPHLLHGLGNLAGDIARAGRPRPSPLAPTVARVGETLIALAQATATGGKSLDVDALIGDLARYDIGVTFVSPTTAGRLGLPALNEDALIAYLRENIANRVEAGKITPEQAERIAEKLTQWVGADVTVGNMDAVVVIRSQEDLVNAEKLLNAPGRTARTTLVVDPAAASLLPSRFNAPVTVLASKAPLVGDAGLDLAALQAALALDPTLTEARLSNSILLVSRNIPFDIRSAPARLLLRQMRYAALEDAVADLLMPIRAMKIGTLLDAAHIIAEQA